MKTMSLPVVIAVIAIFVTAAAAVVIFLLVMRKRRENRFIAQENSYLRAMNRAFMSRYTRKETDEDGEVRLRFADGASMSDGMDEISILTAKVKASISRMMSPDGLIVTNSSMTHASADKYSLGKGEVITMKRDDNDREFRAETSQIDSFGSHRDDIFEEKPSHMFSRNIFKFRVLRGGADKDYEEGGKDIEGGEDIEGGKDIECGEAESLEAGNDRVNGCGNPENTNGISYREEGLRRGLRILPSPVSDKPDYSLTGCPDVKSDADLIMRRIRRSTDETRDGAAEKSDGRPELLNRDKSSIRTDEKGSTEYFDSINRKISGIAILDVRHDVLGSIERVLTDGGYSTRAYEDPVDALKALISEPCNILIVSSRMSSVSGMEFAEYVRQVGGASRIVMMTDYSDNEAQTLLHRGLINGYLTKPISTGELMDKVSAMMDGISGER